MNQNDIIGLVNAAVAIVRHIDESVGFYKECRDLKVRCKVVQNIIDSNKYVLSIGSDEGLNKLKTVLEEANRYLGNRKRSWLYRNPFMEKVFFLRIDKFVKDLDSSIIALNLSVSVCT